MASSDASAVIEDEEEKKAKQREGNRKKHERQKAKKKKQHEHLGSGGCQISESAAGRAQRRESKGYRGRGMFAVNPVDEADVIAAALPALSIVFDADSARVCAFCFSKPPLEEVEEMHVILRTGENKSGFGMVPPPPSQTPTHTPFQPPLPPPPPTHTHPNPFLCLHHDLMGRDWCRRF